MKKILVISLILVIIDQIVKNCIYLYMPLDASYTVIENLFSLTYVRNDGAAWSILSGNRLFLIIVGILALNLIYFFVIKDRKLNRLETISYSLVIGGIMGNLIDRVIHGYVIDYLDFIIFNYNFPIFNIADICIVIGVVLVFIGMILEEKHERNNSK